MQDQGKRLLLAVALALGVMLVWNMMFSPPKEPTKPTPAPQGSGDVLVAPSSPAATPTHSATPARARRRAAPSAPRGEEQTIALRVPDSSTATFSSYGGAWPSWQLTDKRYERDKTKGELHPGDCREPDTGAFAVNFAGLDVRAAARRPSGRATQKSRHRGRLHARRPSTSTSRRRSRSSRSRTCVRHDGQGEGKVPAGHDRDADARGHVVRVPGSEGSTEAVEPGASRRARGTRRRCAATASISHTRRQGADREAALRARHPVDRLRASVPARGVRAASRDEGEPIDEAYVRRSATSGLMRTDILFPPVDARGRATSR